MKSPSLSRMFNMLVENLVFLVAAIVLFFKTAELLALFAPEAIFGFTGLQAIYGAVCALLVEGLLAVTKWSLDRTDNPMAWAYKILLLVVTFGISAVAQVVDGILIRDTLALQPAPVQFLITWGVPLVPSIILALAAGKAVFENIPPAVLADMAAKTATAAIGPMKVYAATTSLAGSATADTAAQAFLHRNTLTAEDKTFIATATDGQILARFGGSARRAREWRKAARDGSL